MAIKSSILAALGTRAAAGGAIAALVAAGGAVAASAATRSANPVNWGQHVVQAVQNCKDEVRDHQARTVGGCVSVVARQHGEQKRAEHESDEAASPTPLPGKREGQEQKPEPTPSEHPNHGQGHVIASPSPKGQPDPVESPRGKPSWAPSPR
jgi:hypothetical protein